MIDFNSIKLDKVKKKSTIDIEEASGKEIAVIGISARLPMAGSIDDFWDNLVNGVDCIRSIPDTRRNDIIKLSSYLNKKEDELEFNEGAYLDEIDKFDYNYFRLSPKEASLMDPNQRLFLETSWEAIEDAGYGGNKIFGSRTGVFVGFGSDSEYKRIITESDPHSISISVSGNVKPIIASRLSYLMDFRGPSLIVDTTCSSSLMAVHLACKAIRNGECDMAVAGGAQIHLIPIRETNIGVESSDGRAKTFDDSSDGTGSGEGIIAMLLKPLWKAKKDGDNIYAVIKGSAANHDGNSIGITAPNAVAQEDAIINAWKDAGVEPETITYIEAHGTGTKLGDPIEIDGIQRAFRKFTDRKQFCAIGSVKTNIGHLDSSAGIAGLLKAILSLKQKTLVPSLHFNKPNRRIAFEESPIYVNEKRSEWVTENFPRRCGVSSFGLSGTNCHIILEEAPEASGERKLGNSKPQILALSAKNVQSLKELINKYRQFISKQTDNSIEDICYTANTGRGHYGCRLAVIIRDIEDLKTKLEELSTSDLDGISKPEMYFGEHKIVPENVEERESGDITDKELSDLSLKANKIVSEYVSNRIYHVEDLQKLCELYTKGADINWSELYLNEIRKRISVPVYPFQRKRCWIEVKNSISKDNKVINGTGYPLLDWCVAESMNVEIYSSDFTVKRQWVLSEHKIDGNCVLVGTTYLEMVVEACKKHFSGSVQLTDIQFLTPLIVKDEEVVEVQLILESEVGSYKFYVVSKHKNAELTDEVKWVKHVEGKVCELSQNATESIDVDSMKVKYRDGYTVPDYENYMNSTVFEFGPRWKNLRELYIGEKELLAYVEMPETFRQELVQYPLHPALLDNALATVPLLSKVLEKKPTGKEDGDIFLPFCYKKMNVYSPFPAVFYSYVRIKSDIYEGTEIINFDISMVDTNGKAFIEIEDYSLKRAQKGKLNSYRENAGSDIFYKIEWIKSELQKTDRKHEGGSILVLKDSKDIGYKVIQRLREANKNVIEVEIGEQYANLQDKKYVIRGTAEDYDRLLQNISSENPTQILHLLSVGRSEEIASMAELERCQDMGVNSLFRLSKSILNNSLKDEIEIVIISENINKVTGHENAINPENASLAGLGKVLDQEYPNIKCRCIDIDEHSAAETIYEELSNEGDMYQVAYRDGIRYIEQLEKYDVDSIEAEEVHLKSEGVYIVTGGLGSIGLEICKHLASKGSINLALINRTALPDKAEWEALLQKGADDKLCKKIEGIKKVKASGSQVTCFSADISSESEMRQVIDELREKYGRINGIIHSAGIAGDGFIIKKDEQTFRNVLLPKVEGTCLLDSLTKSDEPDFFITFSSNNTLMGMPGQGDYTAANSYLDSFAAYRNLQGRRTLTINWTAWKETGMAVDYGVNHDGILKAISTAQALEAFDKALNRKIERIIIGEINYGGAINDRTISNLKLQLSEQIKMRMQKKKDKASSAHKMGESTLNGSIELKGKSGWTYSETEKKIALIWKEVLGFEEFNVNDNFFEIGGDSILITKVHSLIDRQFPGKIQLGDLFAYPTILKTAHFISKDDDKEISKKNQEKKSSEDIEKDILALFEDVEKGKLSIKEADSIVNGWKLKK